MCEHAAHQHEPCDQVVGPAAGLAEGRESDSSNNGAADAERDAQMRMHSGVPEIFGLAERFRRKILGRVLHRKNLAGAEFGDKPGKLRWERAQRRRIDAVYGGRRQNDERAVILEFSKRAAVESEKLPQQRLRNLNFELNLFGRHIGKPRREVGEHALERQKLLGRRVAVRRGIGLLRCDERYCIGHWRRVSKRGPGKSRLPAQNMDLNYIPSGPRRKAQSRDRSGPGRAVWSAFI